MVRKKRQPRRRNTDTFFLEYLLGEDNVPASANNEPSPSGHFVAIHSTDAPPDWTAALAPKPERGFLAKVEKCHYFDLNWFDCIWGLSPLECEHGFAVATTCCAAFASRNSAWRWISWRWNISGFSFSQLVPAHKRRRHNTSYSYFFHFEGTKLWESLGKVQHSFCKCCTLSFFSLLSLKFILTNRWWRMFAVWRMFLINHLQGRAYCHTEDNQAPVNRGICRSLVQRELIPFVAAHAGKHWATHQVEGGKSYTPLLSIVPHIRYVLQVYVSNLCVSQAR